MKLLSRRWLDAVFQQKRVHEKRGKRKRHVFQLRKHALFLERNVMKNGCDGAVRPFFNSESYVLLARRCFHIMY